MASGYIITKFTCNLRSCCSRGKIKRRKSWCWHGSQKLSPAVERRNASRCVTAAVRSLNTMSPTSPQAATPSRPTQNLQNLWTLTIRFSAIRRNRLPRRTVSSTKAVLYRNAGLTLSVSMVRSWLLTKKSIRPPTARTALSDCVNSRWPTAINSSSTLVPVA